MQSDVQLTDRMVQDIADNAANQVTEKMLELNKYELEDMVILPEFKAVLEFYKALKKADEGLANMFSRRLDKSLTKSLSIAPNIQTYRM